MIFMACTTCKRVVQVNSTGTCLGCQRGFIGAPQEDAYEFHKPEVEDALQKSETKSLDAPKQARDGRPMGKRNTKRKKPASKSKHKANQKTQKKKEVKS